MRWTSSGLRSTCHASEAFILPGCPGLLAEKLFAFVREVCTMRRRGASSAPAKVLRGSAQAPDAGFVVEERDAIFQNFRFRNGEVLPEVRIHFATLGTPRRGAHGQILNSVLLLHSTTASGATMRSPEFVSSLYGSSKPLDASKYFLVFVDNIGHGSSSKPSDGLHASFPRYGYRDMVDLQHRVVVETLGIGRLHAIIGVSMGGMHAWLWAEEYPGDVEAVMPVAAVPTRIAGRNLVWRRIVTRSIRGDPSWQGGEYQQPPRGWLESFPLFRMMSDGVPHLDATVRDRAAADVFIETAVDQARAQDANDALYALESSADYDPTAALHRIRAKVFALNFSDDEFNPIALRTLDTLIPKVAGAHFIIQPGDETSFGHSTQAHPALWANHVAAFMARR
jgi:homoserine O-acetyltransferase/O-succinyltransferase